jgi:hypothetical protein
MRTLNQNRNTPYGDAVLAASRQVWLASLGAAVVSREWAQTEAGNVFRTLVKEGTAVESKAIRIVGEGLEGSFTRANAVWRQTRSTVESTVRQLAETAVTMAQKKIPRSLPKVRLPAMLQTSAPAKKTAAKTKRVIKSRATKSVKRAKRTVRAATKK